MTNLPSKSIATHIALHFSRKCLRLPGTFIRVKFHKFLKRFFMRDDRRGGVFCSDLELLLNFKQSVTSNFQPIKK